MPASKKNLKQIQENVAWINQQLKPALKLLHGNKAAAIAENQFRLPLSFTWKEKRLFIVSQWGESGVIHYNISSLNWIKQKGYALKTLKGKKLKDENHICLLIRWDW